MNKAFICRRFKKARSTYDSNAIVQNKMADTLIRQVTQLLGRDHHQLLEIGCGTGLLTNKLINHLHFKQLIINDIIDKPAASLQEHLTFESIHYLPGDAENTSLLPQNLDGILSNATFQWFSAISDTVTALAKHLAPKRFLAFSCFGPKHFLELQSLTGQGLMYPDFTKLQNNLHKTFSIKWAHQETIPLWFPNVLTLLHHIKATGVNSLAQVYWTKSDLKQFSLNYEKAFKQTKGFPLTYHPYYFILQRRN